MNIPQVENMKKPDEFLCAHHILPLPAKTPFGNMCLKHMKIVERLDHVNRKLKFVYQDWESTRTLNFRMSNAGLLVTEEIIYFLRHTIDEVISLTYLVYMFRKNEEYPKDIKVSDIGSLLNIANNISCDTKEFEKIFSDFFDFLNTFNKVANAYKHSFINSDLNLIGKDEPCVPVLNLHHNNLKYGEKFYILSLAEIISQFNEFYKNAFLYIKENVASHL